MEFMTGLFTLVVVVANSRLSTVLGSSSTPSKQNEFRAVMSPQLGDAKLCSMEQPSKVIDVNDILLEIEMLGPLTMMSTIPIHVLCADRCTADAEQGCTGFNYKQDVGQHRAPYNSLASIIR